MLEEKRGWYKAAKKSEKRWGTPVHVQMSIIRQESSFHSDARPPRTQLLGFIPWKRPSDAYGYAQALDSTWDWYRKDAGRRFVNLRDRLEIRWTAGMAGCCDRSPSNRSRNPNGVLCPPGTRSFREPFLCAHGEMLLSGRLHANQEANQILMTKRSRVSRVRG